MGKWIKTEDKRPEYGEPVIVVMNGVTQHVTYTRDGFDNEPDWYEPYFFNHDDNCKASWDKVSHWMPLPKAPKQ
jgi:hypothetical protein